MTVKSNETERAVAKRVEIVFRDFSSFSLEDQREHEVWYVYTAVTQLLCLVFLMYVAAIHLNYSGQESKTHNLQFAFVTQMWLSNKVKVINLEWQYRSQARS